MTNKTHLLRPIGRRVSFEKVATYCGREGWPEIAAGFSNEYTDALGGRFEAVLAATDNRNQDRTDYDCRLCRRAAP